MLMLLCDTQNLYHQASKRFGVKLNYAAIYAAHGEPHRAIAYGCQAENEATPFITRLQEIGFETNFDKPKWNPLVDMTLDIVRTIDLLTVVVICSNNLGLLPLIRWIKESGRRCVIHACNIPKEIKAISSGWIEIDETYLEKQAES